MNTTTINAPTLFNNMAKETMTSLEIAEVTGKQHQHVMRDIRAILSQGVDASNFGLTSYTDKSNRQSSCYELTKKGCLILASGYDALLREKIINRWEELETKERTGGLSLPNFSNPAEAARAWADMFEKAHALEAKTQEQQLAIEAKDKKIEEDKPKVAFADAVTSSSSCCLIGGLAKILAQNGYKIGQNRLFEWLRQHHYLGSKGEYYNMPYQKYIEQGIFKLSQKTFSQGVNMKVGVTTVVTTKGQQYFINKFLSNQPAINFE